MADRKHLVHVKSNQSVTSDQYGIEDFLVQPKKIAPADILPGEIAVNYGKGVEALTIKNSNDEIVSFVNENDFAEAGKITAAGMATLDEKIDEATVLITPVTYAELKALRDNSELKPGQLYRITDFVTTTTKPNTQSAGHAFDIIVLATDVDTLNENARAIKHDGDTYFENSDLDDWEIKYALTSMNDKEWGLFEGENVIRYDEDEYVRDESKDFTWNDTYYYAWVGSDITVYTVTLDFITDENSFYYEWYFAYDDDTIDTTFDGDTVTYDLYGEIHTCTRNSSYDQLRTETGGEPYYAWVDNDDSNNVVFTTTDNPSDGEKVLTVESGKWMKAFYFDNNEYIEEFNIASTPEQISAFKGIIYYMKDEFGNECPYDFKNIQFKRWRITDSESNRTGLNNAYMGIIEATQRNISIVDQNDFIFAYTFSSDQTGGTQTDFSLGGNNVHNNVIKVFGNALNNIVFYGSNNYSNSFASKCFRNTFGNDCHSNSFGNSCHSNSFGNSCHFNSFGNYCYSNSFGNYCYFNSFGNSCYSNSFGNYCYSNSFGNYCQYNSFGNDCRYNSFGNYCYSNSFGNNCYSNSFGNYCQYIEFAKDYMYYIIIEDGNSYITITSTQTTSASRIIRNFTIAQGVNNVSSANRRKTISHNTVNDSFKTTYQNENSTTVDV